ncbi:MAG: hypothetical protein AseanaTS_00880 [Candidatus Pelagadaptatus aseana]|uniref:peptidylprolyl isomerase n=1 Tax=Candidatus Pelagadaptatus aseana TaxID=3120508 RepID=UPI0039B23FC9
MSHTTSSSISSLFRDPLGHFLIGGLLIFFIVAALSPDQNESDDPHTIVVDREVLLNQLQYRAKVFEPALAERKLDSMNKDELETLINQYVHEEVLFREATSLGFGDNDYIIKKRMIQKMDFIIDGVSSQSAEFTDADIQAYYDNNRNLYIEPGYVTFTHVFINGENREETDMETMAAATLKQLRRDQADFIDAPKYGERFPFGLNYVEKTRDLIGSHFGHAMADTLFQLTPDTDKWQGPFRSDYGLHLVMMTKRTEDRQQPLDEVRTLVTREVQNEKRQIEREAAIDNIVADYTIVRRPLTKD